MTINDMETNHICVSQLKASSHAIQTFLQSIQEKKEILSQNPSQEIENTLQTKQLKYELMHHLLSFKSSVRDCFLTIEEWKTKVDEKKSTIEAHELKLQNLLYEKYHLLRECKQHRTISMKEYELIRQETTSLPIIKAPMDLSLHTQVIQLLTKELKDRQELKQQVETLKCRIDTLKNVTTSKELFLSGLKDKLHQMDLGTEELQVYMGKYTNIKCKENHEIAQETLPSCLYQFYRHLIAYKDIVDAKENIEIEIIPLNQEHLHTEYKKRTMDKIWDTNMSQGRLKRSKQPEISDRQTRSSSHGKVPSRSPSIAKVGTSGSGDIKVGTPGPGDTTISTNEAVIDINDVSGEIIKVVEVEGRNDSDVEMENTEKSDAVSIWETSSHGIVLKLRIPLPEIEDRITLVLCFSYCKHLETVMVEILDTSSSSILEAAKSFPSPMNATDILMNLYPQDTGLEIPKLSKVYEWSNFSGDIQAQPTVISKEQHWRMYYWVQALCGLHPTPLQLQQVAMSLQSVVLNIVTRVVTTLRLHFHLQHLIQACGGSTTTTFAFRKSNYKSDSMAQEGTLLIHPNFRSHLAPDPAPSTKLETWKQLKQEEIPKRDIFTSSSSPISQSLLGCSFFRAEFRTGRTKVSAIVEISREYPIRAPRFLFQAKESSNTTIYEDNLKALETEVNAFYDDLVADDVESQGFLLMHQLRKVELVLDVLQTSGEVTIRSSRKRLRRGKDRRLPIAFDKTTFEWYHR